MRRSVGKRAVRGFLLAVIVGLAAGTGVAAAAAVNGQWIWHVGDSTAYLGQPSGTRDLVVAAQGDIDFRGGHIRLMSNDADFQFVHAQKGPARLNAYYLGTPHRTPILIGAPDGANVTSLIVAGSAGQKADLQQWTLNGKTVAAIDGSGRLRLGNVTLVPKLVSGRVLLYAVTAKGKQLVAAGASR